MKFLVRIPLTPTPEQAASLQALQAAFAQVCNAIAPLVQQTRIWNRVALHHMAYRTMREHYPALGSQMVCNAIYSVSRAARSVYQSPASPHRLQRLGDAPLPLLRFADDAPVFFDRHTLSLKDGQLSMYTLDGRMRFHAGLRPEVERRFHRDKLREIVLARRGADYELAFRFDDGKDGAQSPPPAGELPEYVLVVQSPAASAEPPPGTGDGASAPVTAQTPSRHQVPLP